MPNVVHDFPIFVPPMRVFAAISLPEGLNQWWTKTSTGTPAVGSSYQLGFGPDHQWVATVTNSETDAVFELEFVEADADWAGTRVGFELSRIENGTHVRFHHHGWAQDNEHYRTSCYCWAMYLRVMKRYLEYGETVPYEKRLDA